MWHRAIVTIFTLALSFVMSAQGKRVVFIGDSITDGAWGNSKVWNASSDERDQKDMNHIYGHGYMMIIAAHHEALYPEEGWKFWNRGISGNTLEDLEDRWKKDVLDLHPDVVSVLVGTNDVEKALNEGVTVDAATWGKKLRSLLDATLNQNPDVRFVLCTPFVAKVGWRGKRDNYRLREEMIATLSNVIRDVCKDYGAVLVPFDELVRESIASTPDLPASYWIWDGIHPTPPMHYKMAEMWMENTR